jgi:hypothetical protein
VGDSFPFAAGGERERERERLNNSIKQRLYSGTRAFLSEFWTRFPQSVGTAPAGGGWGDH